MTPSTTCPHIYEPRLASFYATLASAESGHATLFETLARRVGGSEAVTSRLDELARSEAEILEEAAAAARAGASRYCMVLSGRGPTLETTRRLASSTARSRS